MADSSSILLRQNCGEMCQALNFSNPSTASKITHPYIYLLRCSGSHAGRPIPRGTGSTWGVPPFNWDNCRLMRTLWTLCILSAIFLVQQGSGQVLNVQPKTDIFVTPQVVGTNVVSTTSHPLKFDCAKLRSQALHAFGLHCLSLKCWIGAELWHSRFHVWMHRHWRNPEQSHAVGK